MNKISRNSRSEFRGGGNLARRCGYFLPWTGGVLLALLFVIVSASSAWSWQGLVVRVLDGDTIEVLNCNDKIVRIHLYGVEAPRKTQYFGHQSARYFTALVHEKPVQVMNVGRDFLGRMRSMVWLDGMSVNEEMVRAGYAWVSNPLGLSPSCERWMGVQVAARESKAGLWNALDNCLARGIVPDLPRSCPIF